jgi:peptidyl-prolyl cis-trans isomerase C
MRKSVKLAATVLAVSAALATVVAEDPPKSPAPASAKKADDLFPDAVVAKGKGIEVKRSEVEEAVTAYKANLAARGGQRVPDEQLPMVESALTDRLVITKILVARATDADKAKAKEMSDKVIEDSKKRFASEDMFAQQLKAVGLSLDQFKQKLFEQATCEAVLERELKSGITISDEQAKKYYEENPANFEQPEMVRASHILLGTVDKDTQQPLPPEKKKAKQALAKELKERAEKGEDFAKLAKEYSEDPGSKDTGGEYTFPRGKMVKEFEAAAFSLKTNQVSDVVETQFGYHVIKLSEKLPAQKLEFAKVSKDLKEALTRKEFDKALPDFFEMLKREYKVEIQGQKKDEDAAKPAAEAKPEKK